MPHRTHRPGLVLLLAIGLALAGCEARRYREVEIDLDQPAGHQAAPAPAPTAATPALRFSLAAMEAPQEAYDRFATLLGWVGRRIGAPVELVQRRTYREVNDLLISGQLDAAMLSTGGLLDLQRRAPGAVEVIAAPVIRGTSTYHSLLIVPAAGPVHALTGLAGRRVAFTDELSLTGRLWTLQRVRELGRDPEQFFDEVSYTHSHRRSVAAVAAGVVDGAAVDSLVFDRALEREPELAGRIRVLERSPPFATRPVVASTRLSPAERARLAEAFLGLDDDPASAEALRQVQIDQFIPPPPGLYEGVARLLAERR